LSFVEKPRMVEKQNIFKFERSHESHSREPTKVAHNFLKFKTSISI